MTPLKQTWRVLQNYLYITHTQKNKICNWDNFIKGKRMKKKIKTEVMHTTNFCTCYINQLRISSWHFSRPCKDVFISLPIDLIDKYVTISYVPRTIAGTGIDEWPKQNTMSFSERRQQTKQVNYKCRSFGKCNEGKYKEEDLGIVVGWPHWESGDWGKNKEVRVSTQQVSEKNKGQQQS